MSNLVIRQSNILIDASYKIGSIGEARLLRLLIAQISPNDEDFRTYQISVSDFARIFNISGGDIYSMVERASEDLIRRLITIRDGESWYKTTWLSSAKYVQGSGVVELRFDKDLKPHLLQLKGYYTEYDLEHTIHFKSIYSVRLFELLKKQSFIADSNGDFKRVFDYSDFRQKMGVNDDEYLLFAHFRVRVIEAAIKEINNFSSLFISEPEYRKTGRKVSSIAFHVSKAKQSKIALPGGSPQVMPVQDGIESIDVAPEIKLLISQGISSDTAKKWLDKYGAERIKRSVEYTLEKQRLGFIKDSLTGYLARTISEDIALSWERENSEKRKKAETKLAAETKRKETEELAKVKKEAEILRSLEAFAILPVENKAEIFNEFAETLVPLLRKRWLAAVKSVDKPECDIRFRELFANFINNVE